MEVVVPKKLIEVALPLDEINKAAAREKSIRHGHPSTLHLWWARRPLAAARAVLFAQLVNDPAWKYSDEARGRPGVRSAITKKRNELFRLLAQLVQWESTKDAGVIERAQAEIRASWQEVCEANSSHPDAARLFSVEHPPEFHDPFAGGGALPLEAQRLGLTAHASDLNPVAVTINKAMIEVPPRFVGRAPVGPRRAGRQTESKALNDWPGTSGLAEDVRRYGAWFAGLAKERLGRFYAPVEVTQSLAAGRKDLAPYVGKRLTVIAWVWARTVRSPNPAFSDVHVPLVSTFMLSKKRGKQCWVEPVRDGDAGYHFDVKTGEPPDSAARGTKAPGRGADFFCVLSNSPITGDYIKAEGKAGRLGTRLLAVVAEGSQRRLYLPPRQEDEAMAGEAKPSWRPKGEVPARLSGGTCVPYGLASWGDLFTDRQALTLETLAGLIKDVREDVVARARAAGWDDGDTLEQGGDGARAYADAIATYLAFLVDKEAESLCSLATWSAAPKNELVVGTFRRQALPMTWDFGEANPFASSSGSITKNASAIAKVIDLSLSGFSAGSAEQADAQTQTTSEMKVISTDPPYYDNINYSDLSDFFYVWMRRSLSDVFPSLFQTLAVPKGEELVATAHRHGGREAAEKFFLSGMTDAMRRLAAVAHPAAPISIYYAFKQSETSGVGTSSTGWETFLEAVLRSGLAVVGTWPMRTERGARSVSIGTNSLASSIVLVCRRRASDAPSVSRKAFLRELDRSLPRAIEEMTADPDASIAPVDLQQACIGPGMALFSKYAGVLEADGSSMSVHDALIHINRAVDGFFAHAEGDLDADSRFCVGWFEQHGFGAGDFGQADVLARAKGTSVDGVEHAGVVQAGRGEVRLYRIEELPASWDPTKDLRTPIWEALHHLCRALADSEGEAGALLAKMSQKTDAVRQLAYRLYTLCERKGWAEHARPYNELITSWPEIVKASESVARGQIGLL